MHCDAPIRLFQSRIKWGDMNTKTILSAACAAALLAFAAAAPAQAAGTLNISYADDANGFIQTNPGDYFTLNGFGGGVTLTDGIAQNVGVFTVNEFLGCCWDDATYTQNVNHTLTLNGVGGGFSNFWAVYDYIGPATNVWASGPVVFNLPEGTVTVSMNGGGGFGTYSANMLFQSSGAPEPAAWALMLTGFLGAGVMLRANRSQTAAATA